jgi:uncharacterized protein (TIGR04551 family)
MLRSRTALSLPLAATLLTLGASALAQTEPARPATPSAAPSATAPAATPATPAAPAPAAPAPATPAPRAIDRGSLLAPAAVPAAPSTAPAAAPATKADDRAPSGQVGAKPSDVYAEDWWSHVRPSLELHGYFRVRAELFHNFSLGRSDVPSAALWPRPADDSYTDSLNNLHQVKLCGDSADPSTYGPCKDKTQAGANMRFRINPELHISENLRVMSQIDMLDNLVLGSTPEGYANQPAGGSGGYQTVPRGGYTPLGAFASSQAPQTSGVNSFSNSITVKRVWGEYNTPVGQLRFGRMPSHWGLGVLANSGDGYDSDYQSTSDRIMFLTGIKSIDLYFGGAWDFANEGATSANHASLSGGQPYDLAQLDDVNQYVFVVVRRRNPELQKLELARGDVVLNGGMYFVMRDQLLANDAKAGAPGDPSLGRTEEQVQAGYVRRGAKAYIPDAWLQVLYRKFRFEAEAVMINGSMSTTSFDAGTSDYVNRDDPTNNGWKIRQYALATQTELKAVEDRLRLQFGFGWASGDPDTGTTPGGAGALSPTRSGQGLQPQVTSDRTFSEFRFHPDYRVDLIFFRNIMTRVQGTYYFRPSVDYDFSRNPNGQRFGGGAAIIWSRASEFVQAPGHKRDLGLELDLSLYYQSKDGSLNDDPNKMGGFFTMLQYGVLFPLAGLDYLPGEKYQASQQGLTLETSVAQTLRWYVGVLY